jgi:hypothetical protein
VKIFKVILFVFERKQFFDAELAPSLKSASARGLAGILGGVGEERGLVPARLLGQKSIATACFD